jgi:hypothetical protein
LKLYPRNLPAAFPLARILEIILVVVVQLLDLHVETQAIVSTLIKFKKSDAGAKVKVILTHMKRHFAQVQRCL